jgi:hypothetical protein
MMTQLQQGSPFTPPVVSKGSGPQIFAPNATSGLGKAIGAALGQPLAAHEERDFEDGEHKTRSLDPVRNADIFIVQSLHGGPTESANDKLCRHESQASSVVHREPQIKAGEPRPLFRRARARFEQMNNSKTRGALWGGSDRR